MIEKFMDTIKIMNKIYSSSYRYRNHANGLL